MKSHFLVPLLFSIALSSSTSAQSNDFEGGTLSPWLDASIATVRWIVEDYASPLEANYPAPNPIDGGTKYARAIRNANLDAGAVILSSDTFTASPGDAVSFSFWIRSRRTLGNTLEVNSIFFFSFKIKKNYLELIWILLNFFSIFFYYLFH